MYTDFRKAFDSVDHGILHLKLVSIGINGPLLAWIVSYLEGRVQVVRVRDKFSNPVLVTSGVPQGSHLGPLLFILFINDLRDIFQHSRFLMYADDLKIFRTISGASDVEQLQVDLGRFEQWCTVNRMKFNTAKCVIQRSHRAVNGIPSCYWLGDTNLTVVADVLDLGVTFSTCLDFRNHYRNIVCKSMKTLGFIARFARHFKGVDTGNAARCNTHIMCPKHGFGGIRCLSLYEQILGWMRSHSKEEGSVHSALVMVGRNCVDI